MADGKGIEFPRDGYEGLVFDLDGTLVDSMPVHFAAWCEALEEYGAAGVFQEDVFYAMGGRPTQDIVAILNGEFGLRLDPVAVAMRKRDAFLRNLSEVEPNSEVVDFARRQQGRVPMAIATGGTRLVVGRTLQMLEMSDLFEEVVTADDVARGKPAPDIYLEAASRLGVPPGKCLAIEDAPSGIEAARAAGMMVVTVPMPMRVF